MTTVSLYHLISLPLQRSFLTFFLTIPFIAFITTIMKRSMCQCICGRTFWNRAQRASVEIAFLIIFPPFNPFKDCRNRRYKLDSSKKPITLTFEPVANLDMNKWTKSAFYLFSFGLWALTTCTFRKKSPGIEVENFFCVVCRAKTLAFLKRLLFYNYFLFSPIRTLEWKHWLLWRNTIFSGL